MRVNQTKAFLYTGVDFTGKFSNAIERHTYVCLFICLAAKMIHLSTDKRERERIYVYCPS